MEEMRHISKNTIVFITYMNKETREEVRDKEKVACKRDRNYYVILKGEKVKNEN